MVCGVLGKVYEPHVFLVRAPYSNHKQRCAIHDFHCFSFPNKFGFTEITLSLHLRAMHIRDTRKTLRRAGSDLVEVHKSPLGGVATAINSQCSRSGDAFKYKRFGDKMMIFSSCQFCLSREREKESVAATRKSISLGSRCI